MKGKSFLIQIGLTLLLGAILSGAARETVAENRGELNKRIFPSGHDASTNYRLNTMTQGWGALFPLSDRLNPSIVTEGAGLSMFPTFDQLRSAFQGSEKRKPWFRRHWLAALFFVFLSLYLVAMIGVSGGPNHGEHPLILNIGHLILLSVYGGSWPSEYYSAYQNLLLAAIGLSLLAFLLRVSLVAWVIRMGITGIYAGLFCLLHLKDLPV
jgi:hypothetical protein